MNGGFFEQKRASPTSFAAVLVLHAVALGAVVLIKGPMIAEVPFTTTKATFITQPPPPPPEPQIEPQVRLPDPPTSVDAPPPRVDTRIPDLMFDTRPPPPPPLGDGPILPRVDLPPPPHVPVRRIAEIDPRYAAALQPPYPTAEQRMGREGTVQLRVTIGVDGRVRAVERISATSDDFWRAAERQALTRWRFRPATVDGRPVESTKVMNLRFVLEGQA